MDSNSHSSSHSRVDEGTGAATSGAPVGPEAVPAAEPAPATAAYAAGGARDVVVAGGGIVGLVTAWRAAQRGLAVTVVDPAPGGGAAQVAAGMLAAVTELHFGEERLLALNLASAERYPAFAAELAEASGQELGYRRCGTLAVALDADDRAYLRELHALQLRSGLESEWLSGRECRRLEPMLAPGVRGGLRVDGDHQIDPRRLASALVTACERAGVVWCRSTAGRLVVRGGRAVGVELADGSLVEGGQTVLAAGSRSGLLAGLPEEVAVPVRPVKGQVVRLAVPEAYRRGAAFLGRTVRAVVRGSHVYLVPRENGELVIGATTEELGWDTTVTMRRRLRAAAGRPRAGAGPDRAAVHRGAGGTAAGLAGQRAAAGADRPAGAAPGHRPPPERGAAHPGDRRRPGGRADHGRAARVRGRLHRAAVRGRARPGGGPMTAEGTRSEAGTYAVSVNGERRELAAGTTLETLVAELTSAPRGVAAAVNEAVVPRGAWTATVLGEGDRVEVLTAVQGG